ncbi:hypothetical protein FOA52_002050 [Chlamydomonas sp. UWO 241]|nr:hypothetical protein FOA52_002050 [Chlamydomonas sp. UWO 241]
MACRRGTPLTRADGARAHPAPTAEDQLSYFSCGPRPGELEWLQSRPGLRALLWGGCDTHPLLVPARASCASSGGASDSGGGGAGASGSGGSGTGGGSGGGVGVGCGGGCDVDASGGSGGASRLARCDEYSAATPGFTAMVDSIVAAAEAALTSRTPWQPGPDTRAPHKASPAAAAAGVGAAAAAAARSVAQRDPWAWLPEWRRPSRGRGSGTGGPGPCLLRDRLAEAGAWLDDAHGAPVGVVL